MITILKEDVAVNSYVAYKATKSGVIINECQVDDDDSLVYCIVPYDGNLYYNVRDLEEALDDILDGGRTKRLEAQGYARYEDQAYGPMD